MRKKQNVINLYYDKNISNIKYVISIDTESDLDNLWDFLNTNEHTSVEFVQIFMKIFYDIIHVYMLKDSSRFFEIILEENEKYIYFTVWNSDVIKLLKKYFPNTSLKYKYDNKKITVKLYKFASKKALKKINKNVKELEPSLSTPSTKKEIPPYRFFEKNDLEEIMHLNDNLQEIVYIAKRSGLSSNLFISLRSTFAMYAFNIQHYKQISEFSTIMSNFLALMNNESDKFLLLTKKELEIVNGFIQNIDIWLEKLFIKGGEELYFMDRSIQADYDIIHKILLKEEAKEESYLEDIFNF